VVNISIILVESPLWPYKRTYRVSIFWGSSLSFLMKMEGLLLEHPTKMVTPSAALFCKV
jgi:hypothetical protein